MQYSKWVVGHLLKIGTLLLMTSPLEMYSKICPTKLDLVCHIPKWVRIQLATEHYFELCEWRQQTLFHSFHHQLAMEIHTRNDFDFYVGVHFTNAT